jgi:cellulose synthase/poly-beta-1,6-N-acetylglucosamine synthase-like glycosyltransferase
MILLIYVAFAVLYLLIGLIVQRLMKKNGQPKYSAAQPEVSVVIAGRNEAEHWPACLHSLANLDYPTDKLEIILVDDGSHDQSLALLHGFAHGRSHVQVLSVCTVEKELAGKAGAVLPAVEKSRGAFVFITDADCQVPQQWIQTHLSYFEDHIGLVGGLTLLDQPSHGYTAFERLQSLDWLFLLSVAFAAGRLGKPLSWMGNNMAFRRSAYDAVGGYRSLGNYLIEDFSLMDAVSRKTPWRIVLHRQASALVLSCAEKTIAGLYRQRKRWALGVRPVRWLGKLLIALSYIVHMLVWLALATGQTPGWLVLFAIVTTDALILFTAASQINRRDLLKWLPAFELFYFLFVLLMPPALVFDKNIIWKEDVYKHPN